MGTITVKNYLLLVLFFLLCFVPAAGKDKEDVAIPVTDINSLPTKYSELFDEVKTKYLQEETSFVPEFLQFQFATRATFKANYGGKLDPKVKLNVVLTGVSDEVMQAISDSAGAYYEYALKAAGYEVVPLSALDGNKSFEKIKDKSDPRGVEDKLTFAPRYTTHAKNFTYKDTPILGLSGRLNLYGMVKDLKKGYIYHLFTINFANFSSAKGYSDYWGETTKSIEISAVPLISIGSISQWVNHKGYAGGVNNLTEWSLQSNFVLSTKQIDNATYEMNVDPAIYKDACLQILKKNIDMVVTYYRDLSKK